MAFFEELKKRHVVQVGIAYLALAWGIAQVSELVLDTFDIPGWVMQLILAALALGFPLALVVAWAYKWRAKGSQRMHNSVQVGRLQDPPVTNVFEHAVERQSIAVLPFVNMSSDSEQEYFSDGISEELLNLLARIPELRVAARTSAFSFKDSELDIPEIARRLHVAHILEGSVRKAGNRIRITAQLIKAENGYHLWSESWDRTLDDIFAVQDDIAVEVVRRLRMTLLKELPTAVEINPEAYALYLQARYLSRLRSAESSAQALDLLEQVLAIAPDFAPAWADKAGIYTMQADFGLIGNDDGHARARDAVSSALAIDPDCAQAHAERGWIAVQYDLDLAAAAQHYLRALATDPSDLAILGKSANLALMMGRFDTAQSVFDYLLSRDPVNPSLYCDVGRLHVCAGRIDIGIAHYRTALRLEPGLIAVHSAIARALLSKGDKTAALKESKAEPHDGFRVEAQAYIYFAMEQNAEADAALKKIIEWGNDAAINIAFVFAFRGEMDSAFEWLEKARLHHDTGLKFIYVGTMGTLDQRMRGDRRWNPFLSRIGMSAAQLDAIEFDLVPPGDSDN